MAEKSDRAKREEEILQFWKENKIFEKSLEKDAPKGEFVFYDGPPFATGMPHYGHILPGTIKDVIPRYKTMQGYRVPRRWGWDCHGLPIENLIEQELGLKSKKDIEKFGVSEFNKRAKDSVLRYEKEWKEIIPRTGRWVDMDNAYKTMDTSYTESVWWSFNVLYKKGLVYEGFKSMHLCPRCETTLSNFEVNLNYKDITDISVYVKFKLSDDPKTSLLIWTTTPWTLPGNVAVAVNGDATYVKVEKDSEFYILLKNQVEKVLKDGYKTLEEIKGLDLLGKSYLTPFDYYQKEGKIFGAEFVSIEEGTGIVHIAPAFGEDDYQLSQKENLPFVQHVGTDGRFKPEVKDFAGEMVKPKDDHQATDIKIIKYLAAKNLLFAKEKIIHSYPHCWRCDTPLLNYAASSWFVKVTDIKEKLVEKNKNVRWVPEEIGEGRFGKWLEGAKDWAVSRSRFWGTPLPVWQNSEGSKLLVDSVYTLKQYSKKSGNKYFIMRHGEAQHNVNNIEDYKGDPNNHITNKGKDDTLAQTKKLKKENIQLIISSPFLRTRESSEIVRNELGLQESALIFDDRIRESSYEDMSSVIKRVGEFIYESEKNYKEKNILIVSHGFPLWTLEKISTGGKAEGFTVEQMFNTSEVRKLDFVSLPHNDNYELDLHRPYIDEVAIEKDGEEYRRVPEVFDTWYDSGSVPFASRAAKDFKPADFIAEGLDQTRGWFYTLAALNAALFGDFPYKQVVVNGLILAEDGKKMSKRLKNYPELTEVLDKYGADALRYYLVSSSAVRAEDLRFSEKGLDEIVKKNNSRLENVVSFYELYAGDKNNEKNSSNHILDRWIDSRLAQLIKDVTEGLEKYELDRASRPIADFIDDLSTWYLRRSRTRPEALPKLREILLKAAQVMAPFVPFQAEDIYRRLNGSKESVHLESWLTEKEVDQKLMDEMEKARKVVSLALEQRQIKNIKVRQPLAKLEIKIDLGSEYLEIIKDEVNVKEVLVNNSLETEVSLDTELNPELIEEGKMRDAIRKVQEWRKEKGLKPGETTKYEVLKDDEAIFVKYKDEIQKATNVEF